MIYISVNTLIDLSQKTLTLFIVKTLMIMNQAIMFAFVKSARLISVSLENIQKQKMVLCSVVQIVL